jgi:hypothetical protein
VEQSTVATHPVIFVPPQFHKARPPVPSLKEDGLTAIEPAAGKI